jgi:hypothetical protein
MENYTSGTDLAHESSYPFPDLTHFPITKRINLPTGIDVKPAISKINLTQISEDNTAKQVISGKKKSFSFLKALIYVTLFVLFCKFLYPLLIDSDSLQTASSCLYASPELFDLAEFQFFGSPLQFIVDL